MAKRYYLGLDNGTTGTTAILFDEAWKPVGHGYRELRQFYPRPGWTEQDAEEIWESVLSTVSEACRTAGITPGEITCLGLANVGETVVLWDRQTGKPVYPAITWQDRRTAEYCEELDRKYGDFVRERAGIGIDSYFSASKISWILEHAPGVKEGARAGRILAGTMDAWLFWKMTAGKLFVTDPSTASRTLLLNLREGAWDKELLDVFGIPQELLPELHESAEC
ncbi:MAG: glycerol kinase, partial [Lachnospiraceae bacterium]|nr:glycerol kinase [Lachnospiraceae bacterium]